MRNAVNLRRLWRSRRGIVNRCAYRNESIAELSVIINSVASRMIKRVISEDSVGSTILAPEAYSEMKLIIDNLTGTFRSTDMKQLPQTSFITAID